MKINMIKCLILLLAPGLILSSCGRKIAEEKGTVAEVLPEGVFLTRDQIGRAGILFGVFEEAELSHDVNARGKLVLPHDKEAGVSTSVGGIITEITVHIGDHVKKGAYLGKLSHPDIIDIQQEYLSARYDYELATSQYERQRALYEQKVASDKNFQESERNYRSARAYFEGFQLNMEQAGFDMVSLDQGKIQPFLLLKSPISGQVDKINTTLGNYVNPDVKIFDVVNRSELHIEVMVFEKDIPLVEVGQRVTFTLSNLGDKVYEASVFAIGSTMDENSRTVPVLAEFNNPPENVYPGMFVAAVIHTGESEYEALPEDALVSEREGEYYVYYTVDDVVNAPLISFTRVRVSPGLIEDGFAQVELLEEVPEGAQFVVSGVYYVRAEFMKTAE